eukprot:TRINITY_DN38073_c0_g1_i12.p1 TRINITY_DN38073_c0_g1~~TRINITY_DN38073_c0_g1_i12.p1  ORF type:complete len:153 (-),score=16.96 TRINITY_DN38073_c0_g1_i12:174-632(-)
MDASGSFANAGLATIVRTILDSSCSNAALKMALWTVTRAASVDSVCTVASEHSSISRKGCTEEYLLKTAKDMHQALDSAMNEGSHSLSIAMRKASSQNLITDELAKKIKNINVAANAARHVTRTFGGRSCARPTKTRRFSKARLRSSLKSRG